MSITIDTGVTQSAVDPIAMVPTWFRDFYADNEDPARIIHDYGLHLAAALNNPKKMETVRRHTLAQWEFLRCLAETHPEIFDEFIVAYAERAQRFD